MEENFDTVDSTEQTEKKATDTLKTLSILSYIGNSLWALLVFMGIILVLVYADMLNELGVDISAVSDLSSLRIIVVGSFLMVFALIILSIIGVYKMQVKLQKSGFILYAVSNGIWSLLLLLGSADNISNLVIAAISGMFIFLFNKEMKKIHS